KVCERQENLQSILELLETQKVSVKADFIRHIGHLQEGAIAIFAKFLYEDDAKLQDATLSLLNKLASFEHITMLMEYALATKVYHFRTTAAAIIQRLGGQELPVGKQCEAWTGFSKCMYLAEEGKPYCQEHTDYKAPGSWLWDET